MAGHVIRTSPSAEPSRRHKWLVVLACILSIAGLVFFVSHRYYSLTKPIDGSIWGEFGDFIGGVVGTIIAYISIRLLIDTLKAQKDANDYCTFCIVMVYLVEELFARKQLKNEEVYTSIFADLYMKWKNDAFHETCGTSSKIELLTKHGFLLQAK